jgi:hypothetical protein
MEKNLGKRLDDMKADLPAVSARVRSLEDKVTNFRKKLTECEVDLCDDFKDQIVYGVIIRRFNEFPTFRNEF